MSHCPSLKRTGYVTAVQEKSRYRQSDWLTLEDDTVTGKAVITAGTGKI